MSIIHNIIPKMPLDISRLNKFVSTIDNAASEKRGEGTHYYWIDGRSTRGFDITIEDGSIEIRNTILSNKTDYELTNRIAAEILSLTNGIIINEEDEKVSLPIFDPDRILELEINDCKMIQMFARDQGPITIFGPVREVHLGSRLFEEFGHVQGEKLRDKIFDVILTVNYRIPNFEYGNIMEVMNEAEEKKIMKLITNNFDTIIDKYDYILLHRGDKKPIMITNSILNTMLPSNWYLVDEFTVVAPVANGDEWNHLLEKANKFDMWDEYNSNNGK